MDLHQRVKRLERQNRWLNGIVLAIFAIFSVGAIMGARLNNAQVVSRAEKFELVDANGIVRGAFFVNGNGSAIALGGPNSRSVILTGNDSVGNLSMGGGQGRVSIAAHDAGSSLQLKDRNGNVVFEKP